MAKGIRKQVNKIHCHNTLDRSEGESENGKGNETRDRRILNKIKKLNDAKMVLT